MAALILTPEIEEAAQRLAEATGSTPAEALVEALRRQIQVLPKARPIETAEQRAARLQRADATLKKLHSLPVDRRQTDDEILGYDESGIPEQPYLGH